VVDPIRTARLLVRPLLPAICLAAGMLLSSHPAASYQSTPEKPGLAVGQLAPSFTLKDQNDKEVTLDSLLKKGPVALVFYRSSDWCMYCKQQLVQLQQNIK